MLACGLQTVATVCMFLAGKVEETPRPLKDVILVSYEIIHKKDPAAVQRIKQKVYFAYFFPFPRLMCLLLFFTSNMDIFISLIGNILCFGF